jgi:hypothetical protein
MSTKEDKKVDAKGIPLKSQHPEQLPVPALYSTEFIIMSSIGVVIAYFTSYFTEAKQNAADAKISILSEYDLGWLYLGIFVVKSLKLPIYINLGSARIASKANVPDQQVYKVMGSGGGGDKLGYVLMETDGVHGTFNRAQRALQHYHKQFPITMLEYVAASWIWPFEAFICVVVWAVSSCISATGYAKSSDGRMSGRIFGFLATATLRGFILIAAYKCLVA